MDGQSHNWVSDNVQGLMQTEAENQKDHLESGATDRIQFQSNYSF